MKRYLTALAVLGLTVSVASADVVYDFETGAQGWTAFGAITTDYGNLLTGGVGGSRGRYHVGDFAVAGWGMGDSSPSVDLSGLTTMSVDARMRNPVPVNPLTGTPEVEFMLSIGYAEWSYPFIATADYQTFTVDIVNLTPNYYASIAPFNGSPPPLDNPNLKIRLITRKGDKGGIGELDFDNVMVTPEPATLVVLAGGALATLVMRRRR